MLRQGFSKSAFAIALFVLLSLTFASAQSGTTTPKYNKATETKIKGVIDDIKIIPGANEGVHLMVKTAAETILVHVGPEKFLAAIEVSFAKGDEVEVTGSKVKDADGTDEILAREIVKGDNVIVLRDDKGVPVWLGWKM